MRSRSFPRHFLLQILIGCATFLVAQRSLAAVPQAKIENPQFGHLTKEMGRSIAIDGDIMIVGASVSGAFGQAGAGVARVYGRDGSGKWIYEAELTAADFATGDNFGWAVAISGDTAVIGARRDDGTATDSGSAYVFTRTDGVWTQQAKLTAEDPGPNHQFGISVALEGDTALIGAWGHASNAGAVYVFTRSAGAWSQQAKIVPADGAADDEFGCSVSLSAGTAVIGAYRDADLGTASGSAYVYTSSGSTWTQQAKLKASDGAAYDMFGISVSISGNSVAIGSYADDAPAIDAGSVYVFARSGTIWSQQSRIVPSTPATSDFFGRSVSLRTDTLIVSADLDDDKGDNSGSAFVFTRSGSSWTQRKKFTADDGAANDYFGRSVAVSDDTACIGSYWDDDAQADCGAAYVSTLSGGTWSSLAKLSPIDGAEGDYFGWSISISGDTAAVSAYADDDKGNDSGSVYVFTRSADSWILQTKLNATDEGAGDNFGFAISLDGDTLLVGSRRGTGGNNQGSVYVFTRSDGAWSQQAKLVPSDPTDAAQFGITCFHRGDTAVIGAWGDDAVARDSGSAYIFTRSGTSWAQQAKLIPSDAEIDDEFGSAVSLSGDTAVIGAHHEWEGGVDAGAAYVFVNSGGVWTQQAKLMAQDAAEQDIFGSSVDCVGDTIVVGAPGQDETGTDAGATYVFTRSGTFWTQQGKCLPAASALNGTLGRSVAISDEMIAIGADGDAEGITLSGSAYLFTSPGGIWTVESQNTANDATVDDRLGFSVDLDRGRLAAGALMKNSPEPKSGAAYLFDVAHPVVFQADATEGAQLTGILQQVIPHTDSCSAVSAAAPDGYNFHRWVLDGVEYSRENPLTVTNVTRQMTLTAQFRINTGAQEWTEYR